MKKWLNYWEGVNNGEMKNNCTQHKRNINITISIYLHVYTYFKKASVPYVCVIWCALWL